MVKNISYLNSIQISFNFFSINILNGNWFHIEKNDCIKYEKEDEVRLSADTAFPFNNKNITME